jgi:hypothetical protein
MNSIWIYLYLDASRWFVILINQMTYGIIEDLSSGSPSKSILAAPFTIKSTFRHLATWIIIAEGVFNRLKSSNIRECVRIARLARNNSAQVCRIIDTFAKYER